MNSFPHSDSHFSPGSFRIVKVRKRRRHRSRNGRLFIFLLFIWLRIIDVTVMRCIYPKLPVIHQQNLVIFMVTTGVWSSGLLLAIWFRQTWAKYLLAASLLFTVIFTLSMIPGLPDAMHPKDELLAILSITAIYLPVALVLMISKHIHKLTEQQ